MEILLLIVIGILLLIILALIAKIYFLRKSAKERVTQVNQWDSLPTAT